MVHVGLKHEHSVAPYTASGKVFKYNDLTFKFWGQETEYWIAMTGFEFYACFYLLLQKAAYKSIPSTVVLRFQFYRKNDSCSFIVSIPCFSVRNLGVTWIFLFQVAVRVYGLAYQCGTGTFEIGCPSWHNHGSPGIKHGPLVWQTHALPIAPQPQISILCYYKSLVLLPSQIILCCVILVSVVQFVHFSRIEEL